MNHIKPIYLILIALNISGCSSDSSSEPQYSMMSSASSTRLKQKGKSKYLAYEHSMTIEFPKKEIGKAFNSIISFCSEDVINKCTILHSSLNAGSYASSNIKLRISPDGVEALLGVASEKGAITRRSTDVEDLQDAIVNGTKRLEMLIQYQNRLLKLEEQSSKNVDSLIKIAEELSKTQSDIEYATGVKAKLLQRTQIDIVNISIQRLDYTSFWTPISNSFSNFGENLSDGISETVNAVAYLLPWALILLLLVYIIRTFWRKTKNN